MKRISAAFILIYLLVGAALVMRIFMYCMGGAYVPVTTDEAITVLQAKEAMRGHFPLLLWAQPYMFPLEAYWMVPFLWLPRTAFGMRALVLLEGIAFVLISLGILRKMGKWKTVWPGIVLVFFPSVYLLMNQTAYSQPHNNSAFLLALVSMWFALKLNEGQKPWKRFWTAFAAGSFGLLAFSNAMLAVSLVVPVLLVCVFRTHVRRWLTVIPGLFCGGVVGLFPYLAGMWAHPGAHQSVSSTRDWIDALGLFWSPALKFTLPVTFGFTPCVFPDSREKLQIGSAMTPFFPYLFLAFLLVLFAICGFRIGRNLLRNKWPYMGDSEMAFGTTLLAIVLFTLSKRADSSSYRYLVPAVVVFPFAVTAVYRSVHRYIKPALGALVIMLGIYNVWGSILVAQSWKEEGFASQIVSAPDLSPAINFMKRKGIGHCVASHWAAYRIDFYTDENIICSQPYNERFPGWPVPYKDRVDAATNVAYVLTERIRFLKPSIFERHMRTMDVTAQVYTAGHFRVYYDFQRQHEDQLRRLPAGLIGITSSHNREDTGNLLDGDVTSRWLTEGHLQEKDMWLRLDFSRPVSLSRLGLYYHIYHHDMLPVMEVAVKQDGRWVTTHHRLSAKLDKFVFRNGHPVYGMNRRTIKFDAAPVSSVRLAPVEINPQFAWTITEIEALEGE